jgi:WD40 repeat protein
VVKGLVAKKMAATNESRDVVHSFKLKGHRQAVLCLASNRPRSAIAVAEQEEDPLIWSGSEDATCRLFDLRTHRRNAVVGILAGAPVLSIAPDPEHHQVYVAAGDVVLVYDVRQPVQPLIRKGGGRSVFQAEDEINQILLCTNNKGHSMVVAGDDAGFMSSIDVGITDDETLNAATSSRLVHDASAMVTSIVCIANASSTSSSSAPPILISGGTDCTMVVWQNGERRSSLHVPNSSTNVNQICNPPMVHTMALLPHNAQNDDDDHYRILAGFGDHSLGVISLSMDDQLQLEWVARIEDVPADAVATSCERIGSAGGGTVAVWNESQAADGVLQQRFAIPHATKVNAISWGDVNDTTLFVADTTNDITCYKISQ